MKIVFFTENSYAGGLDSVIINLINHWPTNDAGDGAEDSLVLICNRSHPGLEIITRRAQRPVTIVPHDIPLHWEWAARLNSLVLPGILKKALSALARYPFLLYSTIAVRKLLAEQNADRLMIINGGYPAGDSCRATAIAWSRLGKPLCVFNFHNFAVPPRWWERWAETVVDRFVECSCKVFLTVSRACAESMTQRPAIASRGKVQYIFNGIEKPTLPPTEAIAKIRREFDVSKTAPLLLMLGTYEKRKGHAFLLNAFALVLAKKPDARLVICGYGYEKDIHDVTTLVREKGLADSVYLQGFRDDTSALIAAADILLVSSQQFESFGLTIVEAMALSTPVVATDIGGIPEVLGNNEGGYCLPATDVEAYASQITTLIDNPSLREQVGKAGLQRYETTFTAERMARQYAELIRNH